MKKSTYTKAKRLYYQAHKVELIEKARDYQKEYHSLYYYQNKKKLNRRSNQWRKNNPDRVAEIARKDYLNNQEERIAIQKAYYRNNKQKCLEYQKKYRAENADKIKARSAAYKLKRKKK